MWPKLLAQLFELLPHITRLVPMADKYFSQKTAAEKANEAALQAMAEGVRGDLGQVTKAHVGLYRQLQELSAQVTVVGETAEAAWRAAAKQDGRVEALERQVAAVGVWVKVGVVILVVVLILIGVLIAKTH